MSRLIRLCALRFLAAGALLAGVALVSCASDVGTALAKEPRGGGGGGAGGGGAAASGGGASGAAAGGTGAGSAAGWPAASTSAGSSDPSGAGGGGGGTSEGSNARRETEEPRTDAIAQAAKDAARYAADASHEASQAADTAVRTVRSAVSEALVAVRRETRRALAVADRIKESIDEGRDDDRRAAEVSPGGARRPGSSRSASRRAQADASFARGSALLEGRKYLQARDQLAEAIALDPEHDRARALLGWSEYFLMDFSGAIITFKAALRRQPAWEGLYNGLGWSRLRLRRYQLAEDAFRSALERNPEYVDASNGLGSVLFERGRYDDALPPLERALDGYRGLSGAEPPEVTILRAKIAWSLYYGERYREALAMFIRASLAAPRSQPLHVGMGWCYLKLGQQSDARAAFQQAEKLGPNDEVVREGLRRASL